MNCQYPTRKGCVAQLKHGAEGSLTLMLTTVSKSIVMVATIPMITFRKLRMDMAQPSAKALCDFERILSRFSGLKSCSRGITPSRVIMNLYVSC